MTEIGIKWIILVCMLKLLVVQVASLRIAVLGAGASGLAAARRAIEQNHTVHVYERTSSVGGIWVYSENSGKDRYGVRYTPMYSDLKTNTPNSIMGYPDFPYPPNTPPYLSHDVVAKYLKSYADHFNITKRILFRHQVLEVSLYENEKWLVLACNVVAKRQMVTIYDAVMVCTSVFDSPRIPEIPNMHKFKGIKMHSRDYRRANRFAGMLI